MSWIRLFLFTLFVAAVGAPTLAWADDAPPTEQKAKKAKKAKGKSAEAGACCKDGKCSASGGDCACTSCKDKAAEPAPTDDDCPCGSSCSCGKDPCTCGG